MNTDTPRTDAENLMNRGIYPDYAAMTEHARELEREGRALRAYQVRAEAEIEKLREALILIKKCSTDSASRDTAKTALDWEG